MKFKINNKKWNIEEVSQEQMREIMKKHNDKLNASFLTDENTIFE